jgi:hypothetical protein
MRDDPLHPPLCLFAGLERAFHYQFDRSFLVNSFDSNISCRKG